MSFLIGEFENPFENWQSAQIPDFTYSPLQVDLQGIPENAHASVQERCFVLYKKSQEILDQAIADTALEYIYPEGDGATAQKGPLLLLAEKMSLRLLDLYQIQVDYDVSQDIPMLPLQAGQLKALGLSSSEIVDLQTTCQLCLDVITLCPSQESLRILFDAEKRKENRDPQLVSAIQAYEQLPRKELLDRACFLLFRYGRYSTDAVFAQLQAIATMKPLPKASLQERLYMEIRHRIAGDATAPNLNAGWLGTNPLAYLNLLLKGELKNKESEFRNRMYFIYASSHLINTFVNDPKLLAFAHQCLDKKEWQIDPAFVAAMHAREPKHMPPTMRYGAYAGLNPSVRESRFDPTFHQRFPQPLIVDLLSQRADARASFRGQISERELLALTGDFVPSSISPLKQVPFVSGGACFRLKEDTEIGTSSVQERAAKSYAKMCKELCLPQLASISGTLDQMATIGGFVGATITPEQLQELKLAMIAFMVPCRDHTVHEILQSAKTFGMAYEPGPQFLRFIAPTLGDRFIEKIERQMEKRNAPMPAFYLSAEAAQQIYQKGI